MKPARPPRFPPGPAAYIVIGGGCFGSFYVRQLLRFAGRAGGPVARIVVIDRDPECRVAREVEDARVELRVADWADHLSDMLPAVLAAAARGEAIRDRLVHRPLPRTFCSSRSPGSRRPARRGPAPRKRRGSSAASAPRSSAISGTGVSPSPSPPGSVR